MNLGKAIKILETWVEADREFRENKLQSDYDKFCEERNIAIETLIDELEEKKRVNKIALKAFTNLYNTVDRMLYDICNQWEDGADIEDFIGELRELMYDETNKNTYRTFDFK